MQIFVYMLRCCDGSYYVGITRNGLEARVGEHRSGRYRNSYTYFRRPIELVWAEEYLSLKDAIACERRIKGWRRAKKEALIRGDYVALSELSKTAKHRPACSSANRPSTGSG